MAGWQTTDGCRNYRIRSRDGLGQLCGNISGTAKGLNLNSNDLIELSAGGKPLRYLRSFSRVWQMSRGN